MVKLTDFNNDKAWRVINKTDKSCRYMCAGKSRQSARQVFFDMFLEQIPHWEACDSYVFSRVPDLDGHLESKGFHDPAVNLHRAEEQGLIIPVKGVADYCFCSKAAANRYVERKMGIK